MPQLDVITFVDQVIYVYIFFIFQYFIVSIFILPGIYQALVIKHLFCDTALIDVYSSLKLLSNSLYLLELTELQFENKVREL